VPKLNHDAWIRPFITELERLLGSDQNRREAGTLAKLRGGLTEHPGERDVWVYAHLGGARPDQEDSAALVASLFALWHQGGRGQTRSADSFGGSYGRLRLLSGSESTEKRFAALIDSHPDDLPARLRHAVTLLRSKDIPIDWERLLGDLLSWEAEKRPVQRRWARDFWARNMADNSDEPTDAILPV
jgi:CRISPR system Cascade subunit CasB